MTIEKIVSFTNFEPVNYWHSSNKIVNFLVLYSGVTYYISILKQKWKQVYKKTSRLCNDQINNIKQNRILLSEMSEFKT